MRKLLRALLLTLPLLAAVHTTAFAESLIARDFPPGMNISAGATIWLKGNVNSPDQQAPAAK